MENIKQNEMNPQEYFNYVKGKKSTITDEELLKVYDNCLELLNKYHITGQRKASKRSNPFWCIRRYKKSFSYWSFLLHCWLGGRILWPLWEKNSSFSVESYISPLPLMPESIAAIIVWPVPLAQSFLTQME